MRFVIIILLLAFTACKSTKPIMVDNYHRDSVFLKETIRDTLIKIESDSAMISALIECDSLGNAHLKELLHYKAGNRTATPRLTLKNNLLTSTAYSDSLSIYLKLRDRYKEHYKREITTKTVEINVLTLWQRYWIKVGKASAIFALILIVGLIIKLWMHRKLKMPF